MKEVDLMCSMHCSGLDPCNSGRSAHPYGPCGRRGVIWLTNASDQIPFDALTGALSIGPLHGWATLIGLIPCSRRIPSCEHMSLCVLFHFRSDVTTACCILLKPLRFLAEQPINQYGRRKLYDEAENPTRPQTPPKEANIENPTSDRRTTDRPDPHQQKIL
jgi:hypothetical protein